jgi:uncharacterized protein (TIGR03066 family)
MNSSRLTGLLWIAVLLNSSASSAPEPSSNRTKIVGVWEFVKSDDGTPPGSTLEFTKDGKIKVETKVGDEDLKMEGTYKVDGDKLTVTIKETEAKEKDKSETVTITKLTDNELIVKDEKGQVDVLKKKK